MQGSHTHIPQTNHVPRGYIVAAVLSLLFMVPLCLVLALALLFFYVSTFRSMCAVPNMAVFCSSLTSWFPGMSLMYFLNDLEMVPVAPIITGITRVFTFHMRCIIIIIIEEGKVEVEEEKFWFVVFTCQNASVPECHISDIWAMEGFWCKVFVLKGCPILEMLKQS